MERVSIAVVIPCFRVKQHILGVLENVPSLVDAIYCIDDACPEESGNWIEAQCRDSRVRVLRHVENQGVGGAVLTGYAQARADGHDIAVKIDGDGQMDPSLIPNFVEPIQRGRCDYTKGNRFFSVENVRAMPPMRLFGNAVLSFFTKLSSGYWNIFDPTNGFTALHLSVLPLLSPEKISRRYFFETDILFRLNIARCVVEDVPMTAVYGDEESGLSIHRIVVPFLLGHMKNTVKRIIYNYFMRDFQVASLEYLAGPLLLLWGGSFGALEWLDAAEQGQPATAGTVMAAALPIILGAQLLLSAISFDVQSVPRQPVHPFTRGRLGSEN